MQTVSKEEKVKRVAEFGPILTSALGVNPGTVQIEAVNTEKRSLVYVKLAEERQVQRVNSLGEPWKAGDGIPYEVLVIRSHTAMLRRPAKEYLDALRDLGQLEE